MTDQPSRPAAGRNARRPAKCPICGRPSVPESRPFCSPRCADIDLGRWFSGHYAIPSRDPDGDETRGPDEPANDG